MRFALLGVMAVAAALLGAGCPGNGAVEAGPQVRPSDRPVRQILVWPSSDAAVNWDGDPEPDGLFIRLYLWAVRGEPPIHRVGTLQCVLYRRDPARPAERTEVRRWEFGPEQMNQLVRLNRKDWPFYPVRLDWQDQVPTVSPVLLKVQFVDPVSGPVGSPEMAFTVTRTGPPA
jgi:hypothetical protein